ncbi:GAF domain-containing sensor histidine kinase [Actinomyces vulturis]|uniref:GAF domain-containing sensor histidine kinase n=1 Tax=Actinomyces vulturis TaxID=1857645 RepID=UPI0008377D43|nr:GAF domain-containing protein [Actinomyces vulturis]
MTVSPYDHIRFPGVPDDFEVPDMPMPATATPDDPDGYGAVAWAVHASRLTSTRAGAAVLPEEHLDSDTVDLLQAALRLTSSLKVRDALRALADSACSLTGAAWGTIAVLSHTDEVGTIHTGHPTATTEELAHRISLSTPSANNAPSEAMPSDTGQVIIDNDLGVSQAFTGPIEGEGGGNLLTVPLQMHGQIYGRMYLCDKPGGFTNDDVTTVLTLAGAAAVAVENARLYRQARDREQWMFVSQELTTLLLSGMDQEDVLMHIAQRVRTVSHADTAALILPSVGDSWVCEIAEGKHAHELVGTFFPPEGRARTTLERGEGLTVASLAHEDVVLVEVLKQFGPALFAPMMFQGRGVGVMLLLREQGAPAFTSQDLEIAELVAGQATMAFELADAQHAEEMATLLDERARIGRDLHDLAIQQLFATGMQISAARESIARGEKVDCEQVCIALDQSLAAVDDSVRQIRSIVRSLREPDDDVSLVERLRREASLARTALGFAPSLVLSLDGLPLTVNSRDEEDQLIDTIDSLIDQDVADDMVAVVREGLSNVARHAHASSVTVDVRVESGRIDSSHPQVEIIVRDDGVGVDPAVTRCSGTANMAERARRHGGSFVMGPRARSDGARRGTCFTWIASLSGEVVV